MDMNAEKRPLLERAIVDPASITPAEKNAILWLPPPDVENQLHQFTFNLSSRDALVTKPQMLGIKNPFEKVSIDGSINRFKQHLQTPTTDRELLYNAQSAVLTPDEERARAQAGHQVDRLSKERQRAAEEKRAKMQELHKQPQAKWVQEIVDAALPRWGFVILRTAYGDGAGDGDDEDPCSDAAWKRFQGYFKGACRYVACSWKGGVDLMRTQESLWVSDRETLDGADTATLWARVRAMREAGQIPEVVREDVFLVVGKDVFCNEQFVNAIPISSSNPRGAVRLRAVDPDHDPSAQPIPAEGLCAGFDGEIAVPLPKVFDWLYYNFFAGSESWPLRYWQTKADSKEDKGKEVDGAKAKDMR
ncbi:hypothetical protein MFIFM68171_09523 [Madurella fahalii]|uniref:Uncharacterized protein n=1 Tax=Madurella fahalii TaxID=1157608 RepID=A0ABQ0GNH2_9PEZI